MDETMKFQGFVQSNSGKGGEQTGMKQDGPAGAGSACSGLHYPVYFICTGTPPFAWFQDAWVSVSTV